MAATSLSLSKTDSLNIYRALISFSGGQIRLSETLQAIYTLCGSQNRHWTSTGLLHALWWLENTLRTSAGSLHALPVVKTDSPNFYRTLTRIGAVKMDTPKPPQEYYTHCGSQNRLSEPLKGSLQHLRWSYPTLQTSTRFLHGFAVVKTDSLNLHRLLICFAVVKTDPPNLCGSKNRLS